MNSFLVYPHSHDPPFVYIPLQIPTGASSITYGQFLQHFPRTANTHGGALHFRFRVEDKSCGYAWMDITNATEQLPTYGGFIFVKVLCLDPAVTLQRQSRLRRKHRADFGSEGLMAAKASQQAGGSGSRHIASDLKNSAASIFGGMSAGPASVASTASDSKSSGPDSSSPRQGQGQRQSQSGSGGGGGGVASSASSGSPIKVAKPPAPAPATAPVPVAPPVDLMDFSSSGSTISTSMSSSSSSSSGTSGRGTMGQPTTATSSSSASSMSAQSIDESFPREAASAPLSREELAARREASIQEKVSQALEFKQEMDENQKREAEELEAARLKFDRNLTTWACVNAKEKRNIRSLLSTMHTVLWEGNTWKPVGLGDVIEDKKVKLYYRKAMLVVHPDRCSALNAETRFIAKRVFEAINEAYQEFLKKGGMVE